MSATVCRTTAARKPPTAAPAGLLPSAPRPSGAGGREPGTSWSGSWGVAVRRYGHRHWLWMDAVGDKAVVLGKRDGIRHTVCAHALVLPKSALVFEHCAHCRYGLPGLCFA